MLKSSEAKSFVNVNKLLCSYGCGQVALYVFKNNNESKL